jgi:hypothetical protein
MPDDISQPQPVSDGPPSHALQSTHMKNYPWNHIFGFFQFHSTPHHILSLNRMPNVLVLLAMVLSSGERHFKLLRHLLYHDKRLADICRLLLVDTKDWKRQQQWERISV